MAASRFASRHNLSFPGIPMPEAAARRLAWLGRHSLAFYLLHQPVLIAMVWVVAQIMPPLQHAVRVTPVMKTDCVSSCMISTDAETCKVYCQCAYDQARQSIVFQTPAARQARIDEEMERIAQSCAANIEK